MSKGIKKLARGKLDLEQFSYFKHTNFRHSDINRHLEDGNLVCGTGLELPISIQKMSYSHY